MTTRNRIRILLFFTLLCLARQIPLSSAEGSGSSGRDFSGNPASLPFPDGETLSFEVRWHSPAWLFFIPSMQAGQITLEAHQADPAEVGQRIWQLVGQARSSGALASLTGLNVQDRFESWMDPKDFCSLSIRKTIREGSRHRDVQTRFFRNQGRLHHLETDPKLSPPKVLRNQEIEGIPPCVQDVISIFYAIRMQPMEVGRTYSLALSDNGRTKMIRGTVEKEEKVQTEIGVFPAYKIRTEALFGGLFREGGEFLIWLHREKKFPVRFEAKVKLGRVFGRLTAYRSGEKQAAPATTSPPR